MTNTNHNSNGTYDRQASCFDQGYRDPDPTGAEVVGEIWDEPHGCTAHLVSIGPTMNLHSRAYAATDLFLPKSAVVFQSLM